MQLGYKSSLPVAEIRGEGMLWRVLPPGFQHFCLIRFPPIYTLRLGWSCSLQFHIILMYVQLCVEHYYVITWISKEVVHSDIRDDSSVDISVFFTRPPNRISGGPMGNYTSCFFSLVSGSSICVYVTFMTPLRVSEPHKPNQTCAPE